MARNEEKAQSMLYRFREAKAMEMGLIGRQDRRPRMASSCKDLKQCERWRGEIMREISRKVTKIQDYGLTDYEVRDTNDEINKLMREKNHWENQIIALGGANYKRAAPTMRNADGREVPGMRGYKYFGRAKELPGVKELFESAKANEDELTSFKRQRYAIYDNVTPQYYGELDQDVEEALLKEERLAEQEEWQDAIADVADVLGMEPESLTIPSMPTPDYITLSNPAAEASTSSSTVASSSEIPPPPPPFPGDSSSSSSAKTGSKRKADDNDTSMSEETGESSGKATKTGATNGETAGNRIFTVLKASDYKMPNLPSLEELEKVLVERQKQDLLSEYV